MDECFSPEDCNTAICLCGGRDNLKDLECCTTRVRIEVSDLSKVDTNGLEDLPMVKGVWIRRNEVQLVIGLEAIKITSLLKQYL